MQQLSDSFVGPWAVIGDFNDIQNSLEKTGGRSFASSSKHSLLNDLDNLSLIDLGFAGEIFTWNNKRGDSHNIQLRLDRGVANSLRCFQFPKAQITHLTTLKLDHRPISLDTQKDLSKGPRPFRFELMWLSNPSCAKIVDDTWNHSTPGPPFVQFMESLKTEIFIALVILIRP